jgi:hypothetical protein
MLLRLRSDHGDREYMKGLIVISLLAFGSPSYVKQTHVQPPNLLHPANPFQYSRWGYKITRLIIWKPHYYPLQIAPPPTRLSAAF